MVRVLGYGHCRRYSLIGIVHSGNRRRAHILPNRVRINTGLLVCDCPERAVSACRIRCQADVRRQARRHRHRTDCCRAVQFCRAARCDLKMIHRRWHIRCVRAGDHFRYIQCLFDLMVCVRHRRARFCDRALCRTRSVCYRPLQRCAGRVPCNHYLHVSRGRFITHVVILARRLVNPVDIRAGLCIGDCPECRVMSSRCCCCPSILLRHRDRINCRRRVRRGFMRAFRAQRKCEHFRRVTSAVTDDCLRHLRLRRDAVICIRQIDNCRCTSHRRRNTVRRIVIAARSGTDRICRCVAVSRRVSHGLFHRIAAYRNILQKQFCSISHLIRAVDCSWRYKMTCQRKCLAESVGSRYLELNRRCCRARIIRDCLRNLQVTQLVLIIIDQFNRLILCIIRTAQGRRTTCFTGSAKCKCSDCISDCSIAST